MNRKQVELIDFNKQSFIYQNKKGQQSSHWLLVSGDCGSNPGWEKKIIFQFLVLISWLPFTFELNHVIGGNKTDISPENWLTKETNLIKRD